MRKIPGIAAVALALALTAGLSAQVKHTAADDSGQHAMLDKCYKACVDCAKECESCFNYCTKMVAKGEKMHEATVRTCADCGDLCLVAAKLTARHGPFMGVTCDACAKVCDGCAAACEKHGHDEMMVRCAKACRDCAKECRVMVKAVGTAVTLK